MDQRNILLAVVISLAILLAFEFFFAGPQRDQGQQTQQTAETQTGEAAPVPVPDGDDVVATPGAPSAETAAAVGREKALAESPRVHIESDTLRGSISLQGGRLDDLVLTQYRETLAPDSPDIELLRPVGGVRPYFANFGWTGAPEGVEIPTTKTLWEADRDTLSPGETVTLTWDNGQGLRFERSFSLDTYYMFEVTQRVVNESGAEVTLSPYGLISRTGTPEILGFYILHEGLIGVFDETLNEIDYSDLVDDGPEQFLTTGGWLGITDKYWLVALVPDQKSQFTGRFLHEFRNEQDKYQADYIYQPVKIPAGAIAEVTNHFFAGAKKAQLLDGYREEFGIPHFDRAIDFGWFWFLTKPFFHALHLASQDKLGNFGLAILALTVLIKLAFFPLANKSYKAMAKMRKLQPEMLKLRERFGDDKQRLNQEMMALYKKEGANPHVGLSAHRRPDSGLLRPLQGALRLHRDAPGALLRLDQGPLGAGPDQHPQRLRATALGRAGTRHPQRHQHRHLAPRHGDQHVAAAAAQPPADRSGPGQDLPLHADRLHLPPGPFPGWSGDLLDLEQRPVDRAAVRDHAARRAKSPSAETPSRRAAEPGWRRYRPMSDGEAVHDEAAIEHGRWLFAQDCDLVISAARKEQLPVSDLPEIAFAGRSNVGKSSLVNALTGRKTLARTSNTPAAPVSSISSTWAAAWDSSTCPATAMPGPPRARSSSGPASPGPT